MRYFLIILSVLSASIQLGQAENVGYDPLRVEIEDGNWRVEKWSKFLEGLSADKPLSASDLEQLAIFVSSNSPKDYSQDRSRSVEIHKLHKEGLTRLLEHKGHAEHFANRIISIHERLEQDETNWPLAWSRVHHPMRCLQRMPSHECVVELTNLLDMQSNWFGNRFFGREQILFKGQKPNDQSASIAGLAASALYEIGIEDGAPKVSTLDNGQIVQLEHGLGGDFFVHEWRKWWQEVVDGKRTFGFEGDPRRYNHLGVVKIRDTSGKKSETKLFARKPQVKDLDYSQIKNPRSLSWLYWMLGVLILGGLGVLVWNSRKGSPTS